MKPVFFVFFVFLCISGIAQSSLPTDETHKITFANVVKADSLKKELLGANIKSWLATNHFTVKSTDADSVSTRFNASGEFFVYARGYISKKIHGKITYTVTVEAKDFKYRYFFTNFVYAYYKEDRNRNMKPSGQTKPLDDTKAPGWQALWDHHKRTTATKIENSISQLAIAATQPPLSDKPVTTTKKVITPAQDW